MSFSFFGTCSCFRILTFIMLKNSWDHFVAVWSWDNYINFRLLRVTRHPARPGTGNSFSLSRVYVSRTVVIATSNLNQFKSSTVSRAFSSLVHESGRDLTPWKQCSLLRLTFMSCSEFLKGSLQTTASWKRCTPAWNAKGQKDNFRGFVCALYVDVQNRLM